MKNVYKFNQDSVLKKFKDSNIDDCHISYSGLVDEIILSMQDLGIIENLCDALVDKRASNKSIPLGLILVFSAAAKMKVNTSLTDIPYAITDHRVLAKLGYNIKLDNGLLKESGLRYFLDKYNSKEWFSAYNNYVQNYVMPKIKAKPNIHILDCTDISVNLDNENYEGSTVVKRDKFGNTTRGYKLSTLRGIVDDTGLIEEVCFGDIKTHDLKLSKPMLYNTKVFNEGDILIEDRGFIDMETMNFLKLERGVDTYIPLKTNMDSYKFAVATAKQENNWEDHPTRENQKVTLVKDIGQYWNMDIDYNQCRVALNGAVIWDKETNQYMVFVTTDTSVNAKQIIMTYELRPEIEEDYRQLKDFWKIEDFKSTKLRIIAFHIISTLIGYMFFQLYTMTIEGEKYSHKCLPVILKNYVPKTEPFIIVYSGDEFAIMSFGEFLKCYDCLRLPIKKKIAEIIGQVT